VLVDYADIVEVGRHLVDAEVVSEATEVETGASIENAIDCGGGAASASRCLDGLSSQRESFV
jgi:hypothetical protein